MYIILVYISEMFVEDDDYFMTMSTCFTMVHAQKHIVSSGRCCRNGGSGAMADGDGAWDSVLSEQYSVPAAST